MYRHSRDIIKVSEGANSFIIDFIKEKGESSFVNFLSQAKWIHVTSFYPFEHFAEIMKYVIKAKENNRFLRVSIDPGSQYTEEERNQLQSFLKVADYVFLSKDEYENLIIGRDLPENVQYIKLAAYFNDPENVDANVLVVKHKNRHELIDFINGIPYVHLHKRIGYFQMYNDTGAGDCFAGGFIAGRLSDKLIAQQPAAIELGVMAAKARMTSGDSATVYERIGNEAEQFFKRKYKNGRYSFSMRVKFFFKSHYSKIIIFLSGVIVTYFIERILSMFV